jgi:drug/metabolite transporter (DMT)-like permease
MQGYLILLSGFTQVLSWLCLFTAYRYSSMSLVTIVYLLQPLFVLLLGAVFYKRPLPSMSLLILAVLGVAFIRGTTLYGDHGFGIYLALLAGFFSAVTVLVTQSLKSLPAAQVAALQMLPGVILAFPLAGAYTVQSWLFMLGLGILPVVALFKPRVNHLIFLLFIVVFVLLDAVLLNTKIFWYQYLGIALLMLAFSQRVQTNT